MRTTQPDRHPTHNQVFVYGHWTAAKIALKLAFLVRLCMHELLNKTALTVAYCAIIGLPQTIYGVIVWLLCATRTVPETHKTGVVCLRYLHVGRASPIEKLSSYLVTNQTLAIKCIPFFQAGWDSSGRSLLYGLRKMYLDSFVRTVAQSCHLFNLRDGTQLSF